MRLLHVSQPTATAGVPRVVADLVRHQVRSGHEVTVACPQEGELDADVRAAGAAWQHWPASRTPGLSVPREVLALRTIVRQVRPDVVHLHSSKAGLAGRLAIRGRVPTLFQPHAWSFDAVSGPVHAATVGWERLATRWTDVLVHVSESEQARGRAAGVHAPCAVVVPNGVDVQAWSPADAAERLRARQRLQLPAGPLVVCVGRLVRQKGQDLLLTAWADVAREVSGAHLALVGGGEDEQALRARQPPATTFAGARDDVPDWLAAADVVVLPSRWEGMALVPLEAMARSRSVVAFDVTGVAESMAPGSGAVVPQGDTRALGRALVERLSGAVDADAEGRRGRDHVVGQHDLRRVLAITDGLYARLAAGQPVDGVTGR